MAGGEGDMVTIEAAYAAARALRHKLHAMPELSGEEAGTAREVVAFLTPTGPDRVLTGLGGHGVAAVYEGQVPGPTVLLRSELDALPIVEITDVPYRSTVPGKAHLCGHDGHTATLAALALRFAGARPARGRVVLLFQPAEENGAGARAVAADRRFGEIAPDMSFAYHNMPGVPFGEAWLAAGPVACASRGMRLRFEGKSAHASQPSHGVSPMETISRLMPALAGLGCGTVQEPDFAMVTVTHARLGAPAFGVAPGEAEVWATLRTQTDDRMAGLVERAEALVRGALERTGLRVDIAYDDVFDHVENAPEAVAQLRRALQAEGIPFGPGRLPFPASEDFGIFGRAAPSAMVFIGAGESHPSLHNPDYDFPDALIPIAAGVLERAARQILD